MSVLLRQPHGFEGLLAVEKNADALDLAIGEVPNVCGGDVTAEAYATRSPAHVEAQEPDYPVSADGLQSVDGPDPEIRACIAQIGEIPLDPFGPFVDAFNWRHRGLQLDVLSATSQ